MNLDTILLVLTTLGIREIGGQLVAAWTGKRKSKRDDFDTLTERLQTYVASLESRIKDLETRLGDAEQRAMRSEGKVIALESFVQSLIGATEMTCPNTGEPCILRNLVRSHVAPASDGRKG